MFLFIEPLHFKILDVFRCLAPYSNYRKNSSLTTKNPSQPISFLPDKNTVFKQVFYKKTSLFTKKIGLKKFEAILIEIV